MSAPLHLRDVAVPGGDLRVAVWEPRDADANTPTILAVHGVTASHLAWQWLAERLSDVRIVAPDLRGRGRSRDIDGSAGMARHADDLAVALDVLGVRDVITVGHSMGAFAAVVLAWRHPERVRRLVLVDGGLPLDVPSDLDPDAVVARVLGPTADRLAMRFGDLGDYLAFWRRHPAFAHAWDDDLETYFAYDLVPAGAAFVPSTRYGTVRDDTIDLNTGTDVLQALDALTHPTRLLTVPRGLLDEEPGLYPPSHLDTVLSRWPGIAHERHQGLNHYTVVMSDAGADLLARVVSEELSRAAAAAV